MKLARRHVGSEESAEGSFEMNVSKTEFVVVWALGHEEADMPSRDSGTAGCGEDSFEAR